MKKENEKLKGNLTASVDTSSPEGKRILILQEEKQRLKKEIEEIWLKVESQEVQLQKKNLEVTLNSPKYSNKFNS